MLATRVRTGQPLDEKTLFAVEAGENALLWMGFSDFRVRTFDGRARLEFTADQIGEARESFEEIRTLLAPYFTEVESELREREKSR